MADRLQTLKAVSQALQSLGSRDPSPTELEPEALKTGWLYKRGGGRKSTAWKKRWFVLYQDTLFWFISLKDRKPKGGLVIKQYIVEESEDGPYGFKVSPQKDPNGRIYKLRALSEDQKASWMETMSTAASGNITSRTTVEIEQKLRREQYAIPPEDLEWGTGASDILGKGASGVVKKGRWLRTTDVAIKALNNLPEFTDSKEMASFYKEIEMLSQLRHPNIVPMFGYCRKDGYICLVTEYVKGGTLYAIIHDKQIPYISIQLKVELLLSIARGMVYLHSKKIIHRDLKPQNILVENLEEAKLKVCDFGISTITRQEDRSTSGSGNFGSPAYAAPEMPDNVTSKVDVFSTGVIMWELYTRKELWPDVKLSYQIQERVRAGQRMPLPPGGELNSLIKRCWETDAALRPTFPQTFSMLEEVKQALPPPPKRDKDDYNDFVYSESSTRTSMHLGDPKSASARIVAAFEGKTSIPFLQFQTELYNRLGCTDRISEGLRYCLVDKNLHVSTKVFRRFLEWFTPLSDRTAGYVDGGTGPVSYTMEEIASIVGPKWFVGFMNADTAKAVLSQRPVGSFLLRFSSSPPSFALSLNYGAVGHWRITVDKAASMIIYRIDGRPYKSLYDIVESHAPNNEPLSIKAAQGMQTSCYLMHPVDKFSERLPPPDFDAN